MRDHGLRLPGAGRRGDTSNPVRLAKCACDRGPGLGDGHLRGDGGDALKV